MYKWLHRLAWAVLAAMFFHNLWFWGGVTMIPGVGARLMAQSIQKVDAAGVAFYAQPGREFVKMVGRDAAREYAEGQIGAGTIAKVDREMVSTPRRIRDAMGFMPRLTYYGAPWVLLVALLLYWFRPKPIRSLGSGG